MAKLTKFKVTNFRNVHDSDWIDAGRVTALIGQNEAGKSNLCEALFKLYPFDDSKYDVNFDWPVDLWEKKDPKAIVCRARFELSKDYSDDFFFHFENIAGKYDYNTAWKTVSGSIPKFVYIFDYDMSGQTIELPHLAQRIQQVGYSKLTSEEQTIKIILDLAKVDIDDFLKRGDTPIGRTLRSYDKRQASAFLTRKFQELWKQKKVDFDIEIDGPTLNIFVQDVGFSMPVRLDRRSTGFRWYVSFAWRFTHATAGEFKDVILLLEEPGIHLHPAGQRDLVQFFNQLGENNQVIYTTHLPSMIDTGTPERVRIVEVRNHHTRVIKKGIVSPSRQPMLVIEAALGLSPSMSDLLGHRSTLIVEGTDDFVILNKLAGV